MAGAAAAAAATTAPAASPIKEAGEILFLIADSQTAAAHNIGPGNPGEMSAVALRLPHFCIIGAQKAGTTTLYDALCRHPLVIPARRKEPHFLDWRWNPDGCLEGFLSASATPLPERQGGDWGGADIAGLRRQWQHGMLVCIFYRPGTV